jgi:hypothetical protein
MDPQDRDKSAFELLMSEKQLADSQVGGYMELHVKVLGFLAAAVVFLGWLYSGKSEIRQPGSAMDANTLRLVCLCVVLLTCGVVLQSIVVYGLSVAHLQYRNNELYESFQKLLGDDIPPFGAVNYWTKSAASTPVMYSAAALFATHAVVSGVLLTISWGDAPHCDNLRVATVGVGIFLLITLIGEVQMSIALNGVHTARPAHKS